MSDLMREEFEAWAITNAFLGLSESCMERHNEGYLGCELHAAWEAWQASRECLVIELPESVTNSGTAYIETIRAFIEKQGIKTK